MRNRYRWASMIGFSLLKEVVWLKDCVGAVVNLGWRRVKPRKNPALISSENRRLSSNEIVLAVAN